MASWTLAACLPARTQAGSRGQSPSCNADLLLPLLSYLSAYAPRLAAKQPISQLACVTGDL
eukprot:2660890-Amphidinium_carterae.1